MFAQIEQASRDDLDGIARIKQRTWLEEPVRRDLIGKVLASEEHCVHVVRSDGAVIGFADGFVTLNGDGKARWEVDLLAVDPDQRGKQLGEKLVRASLSEGRERGAYLARALIGVENFASQITFRRCDFAEEMATCCLYISAGRAKRATQTSASGRLLPVTTINYRGVWIENSFDTGSLSQAQRVCQQEGMDLAGAVIPLDNCQGRTEAEKSGYSSVGHYAWWVYRYK